MTVKEASPEFFHAGQKNNVPAINNLKQSHDKAAPEKPNRLLKEEDTRGRHSFDWFGSRHRGSTRTQTSCVVVIQTLRKHGCIMPTFSGLHKTAF